MSNLEENIMASVKKLSRAADHAVRPDGTPLADALDWLNQWSRQAAEAKAAEGFALRAAASLAELFDASLCAVARADHARRQLLVDVRRADNDWEPCTVGEVAFGFDDADSLFAHAARSNELVRVDDLTHFDIQDEWLASLGWRNVAVMPLRAEATLIGAIALGDGHPRALSDSESALLAAAGHLVATTISRTSAQSELQQQRGMLHSLRGSMEAAMFVLAPDGTIADVNAAACVLTGFEPHELVGRSAWSALLVAEDLDHVKQAFARLYKSAAPERFESYVLNKNGARRRVSWSASRLQGEDASRPGVICTGVDITERCEAVERAVRAEATAVEARQMFTELQQRITAGEEQLSAAAMVKRLPAGVEYDRRARSRREYPYYQLIAPLRDGSVPAETAFAELKCHDISSRGFSFISSTKPDFDRIVVAFGSAPTVVYLTADIRHATAKTDANGRKFIVGCRYTGRLRGNS